MSATPAGSEKTSQQRKSLVGRIFGSTSKADDTGNDPTDLVTLVSPVSPVDGILKTGKLMKKGMGSFYRPWTNRKFILNVDCTLSYYDEAKGIPPLGTLDITDASVTLLASHEADGRDFSFMIAGLKSSNNKQSPLLLSAESQAEAASWISALKKCINDRSLINAAQSQPQEQVQVQKLPVGNIAYDEFEEDVEDEDEDDEYEDGDEYEYEYEDGDEDEYDFGNDNDGNYDYGNQVAENQVTEENQDDGLHSPGNALRKKKRSKKRLKKKAVKPAEDIDSCICATCGTFVHDSM
jgi:hypothetical protein